MNAADIERLAREAGMWQDGDRWFTPGKSALDVSTAQLARFAALVEATERERCAELCEQWDATHPVRIAAAIRGAVCEAAHGIKE